MAKATAAARVLHTVPEQGSVQNVDLKDISLDLAAQPRTKLSEKVIREYVEDLGAGAEFPPIVVFWEEGVYWLADGWHRYHAHLEAGKKKVLAEVRHGSLRDAILYSVSANAAHGFRRSDEDKRRAVQRLLDDKEWSHWSDREIARLCAVSHTLVAKMRPQEEKEEKTARRTVRRGKQVYTIEKKKPKKKPAAKVAPPAPAPQVVPAPMNEDGVKVIVKQLRGERPKAVVNVLVGVNIATVDLLPEPQSAVGLLGARPQGARLLQIARWYQDLAFAVTGDRA